MTKSMHISLPKQLQKRFVYVDRRLKTFKPFYVGYGNQARLELAFRNGKHRSICNRDGGCCREILFETFDIKEAKQIEILYT